MKGQVIYLLKKTLILCSMLTLGLWAAACAYVGNSHSMKFHSEGCRAEQKIRADHRVYLATREDAINSGYKPCGICKP